MARKKILSVTWRAKWTCDGCDTVRGMAKALEDAAAGLREMEQDGFELIGEVEDDYAMLQLETDDPELIAKYRKGAEVS